MRVASTVLAARSIGDVFSSFGAGVGSGFVVAAQVGPIWLLCARSVLRGRLTIGAAIGAGAALVDMSYAAVGVLGGAGVMRAVPGLKMVIGLVGALILVALGLRTIWSATRIRAGMETAAEVSSPLRAFGTAVAATASNPLTIASWAALFTATSAASITQGTSGAILLVLGVGIGSLAWFVALSGLVSALRRRIDERAAKAVDFISGIGLAGFGVLLGVRSLHSH